MHATQALRNSLTACCSIAPVRSNYTPKGTYKPYAGFKRVYVTGPEKSDTALVAVYDILGFQPQTQQGADILAQALGAIVLMPDFFEPHDAWPRSRFPATSEKDKEDFRAFFAGPANAEEAVPKLRRVGEELRKDGAKTVGTFGFCWGGKVTMLAGSEKTPFDAVSLIHPAMLQAGDADNLATPLGIYISKDEPIEEYNKIVETISSKPFASKNDHKLYSTMFHGWAAGRANLEDPENKKQYENLYATLGAFFKRAFDGSKPGPRL